MREVSKQLHFIVSQVPNWGTHHGFHLWNQVVAQVVILSQHWEEEKSEEHAATILK